MTVNVYVNVRVGGEAYALPIESVLEVKELDSLTALPGAGAGALGLSNFHGQVLPVFDLAYVLSAPDVDGPARLVVSDHAGRLVGLAVDEVANVGSFDAELEPAESEYLSASALVDGRLVGVVDLDRVFARLEQAGP
jgi:purine-binding chemotaxis protein CheW